MEYEKVKNRSDKKLRKAPKSQNGEIQTYREATAGRKNKEEGAYSKTEEQESATKERESKEQAGKAQEIATYKNGSGMISFGKNEKKEVEVVLTKKQKENEFREEVEEFQGTGKSKRKESNMSVHYNSKRKNQSSMLFKFPETAGASLITSKIKEKMQNAPEQCLNEELSFLDTTMEKERIKSLRDRILKLSPEDAVEKENLLERVAQLEQDKKGKEKELYLFSQQMGTEMAIQQKEESKKKKGFDWGGLITGVLSALPDAEDEKPEEDEKNGDGDAKDGDGKEGGAKDGGKSKKEGGAKEGEAKDGGGKGEGGAIAIAMSLS